jgi:hypothetical protein
MIKQTDCDTYLIGVVQCLLRNPIRVKFTRTTVIKNVERSNEEADDAKQTSVAYERRR